MTLENNNMHDPTSPGLVILKSTLCGGVVINIDDHSQVTPIESVVVPIAWIQGHNNISDALEIRQSLFA